MSTLPSEDVAYVRVATPLSVKSLHDFCGDLERLYRINPMLEFTKWQKIDDNQYYLQANNLSNGQEILTKIYQEETDEGFKITYSEGLKAATFIQLEKSEQGTTLVIIDDYNRLSEAERTQRLAEVDHSLKYWGQELYRYLHNWQRWHWFPPYRWYMRRVWQPMKPSARRITYMLIIITLFELFAFLMIVGLWAN
ncbi:hypothetical protein [Candidatus Parabeggiatoa sp. HSG14]|uniref:hypothetical protein n=1 Tax=Candidatus Parabeggiatoa sp. HSG14 TaxID=3055593 RepID=UPI0025A86F5B|nr:hypothetical protein [Thiotrichales bacterium HSG14]